MRQKLPVIVLQPEVIAKLKKKRILTKVLENCKKVSWTKEDEYSEKEIKQARVEITKTKLASKVLLRGFSWERTPEKSKYWVEIYNELYTEEN